MGTLLSKDCVNYSAVTATKCPTESNIRKGSFLLTLCENRESMVAGIVGVSMWLLTLYLWSPHLQHQANKLLPGARPPTKARPQLPKTITCWRAQVQTQKCLHGTFYKQTLGRTGSTLTVVTTEMVTMKIWAPKTLCFIGYRL